MPGDAYQDGSRSDEDADTAKTAREAMVRAGRISRSRRTAALDYLRRDVSANQPQPWTSIGFQIARDQQIALLEAFADRERMWLDLDGLGERKRGRMEHDIFRPEQFAGVAYKVTKGTKFGFLLSASWESRQHRQCSCRRTIRTMPGDSRPIPHAARSLGSVCARSDSIRGVHPNGRSFRDCHLSAMVQCPKCHLARGW